LGPVLVVDRRHLHSLSERLAPSEPVVTVGNWFDAGPSPATAGPEKAAFSPGHAVKSRVSFPKAPDTRREPAMTPIPTHMTAIAIKVPGGPDVLVPEQQPVPVPAENEVLIKVAAAGVNRPDVMQRQGLYPPPKGVTDIPGLEIAGEVAACGPGAVRWKPGDR